MIYLATNRGACKDYKLLLDVCKLIQYNKKTKQWPLVELTEDDLVLGHSTIPINLKGNVLNDNASISLANNKSLARQRLIEAGLPTPRTWFDIDQTKLPYIARPPRHSLGHNFHIVNTPLDHKKIKRLVKKGWYFSEIFPTKKEYRVIVFKGEVIFSFEKMLWPTLSETIKMRRRTPYSARETIFSPITFYQEEDVLESAEVLGLDFCGVDLCVSEPSQSINSEVEHAVKPHVIIEVNSAPIIWPEFADAIKEKLYETKCIH